MVFDFIRVIPNRLTELSHVFTDGLPERIMRLAFDFLYLLLWLIFGYSTSSQIRSFRPKTFEEAVFQGASNVGSNSTEEILSDRLSSTNFGFLLIIDFIILALSQLLETNVYILLFVRHSISYILALVFTVVHVLFGVKFFL